jgi:inosine-uridine nucleoside N-ribohydrolase
MISGNAIPVILDTDIGDDIDDTWALIQLLHSPELEPLLITTGTGNTRQRAKIVARLLEIAGRTDIPIGIGAGDESANCNQAEWVADYSLDSYPGTVHVNAVQAIIEAVENSPQPVTLICIGPLPNIGALLIRQPELAGKLRFVGMHGSVREGYSPGTPPDAETNVKVCTPDCQQAFSAPWDMTITPLDTCGRVTLDGELYQEIYKHDSPLVKALLENSEIFLKNADWIKDADVSKGTSALFDCVAVYLAHAEEFLGMEELNIKVTDDGFTRINPDGKLVRCAMKWKDLGAFKRFLVERILA